MKIYLYFKELKNRFILNLYTWTLNCYCLYVHREQMAYFLGQHQENFFPYFIATNLTEIFTAFVKLSVILGLYFSYPFLIFQIFCFLSPGLYEYEYKRFYKVCIISCILHIISLYITYFFFLPYCWKFFLSFELNAENTLISIHIETRLKDYLNFFIKGLLLFTIFFNTVFLTLSFYNKLKVQKMIKYRKGIYMMCFLTSTIITPPDIYSQLILGSILIIIFELFLALIIIRSNYKNVRRITGLEPETFKATI